MFVEHQVVKDAWCPWAFVVASIFKSCSLKSQHQSQRYTKATRIPQVIDNEPYCRYVNHWFLLSFYISYPCPSPAHGEGGGFIPCRPNNLFLLFIFPLMGVPRSSLSKAEASFLADQTTYIFSSFFLRFSVPRSGLSP